MRLICNTDGAIEGRNPSNVMGAGVVIKEEEPGGVIHGLMKRTYLHKGNSYVSEYIALIYCLEFIQENYELSGLEVVLKCDLQPMIRQLKGIYKFGKNKPDPLGSLYTRTKELVKDLKDSGVVFTYIWIPREQNEQADKLSKYALDLK